MAIKSGTGFSSKSIMSATVATVKLGTLEFEGLRLAGGAFAIAIPQLVALNLIAPDTSLAELKLSLGVSLPSAKKVKTKLHPESVNCISLSDFSLVLYTLNRRRVPAAVDMVSSLFSLSANQLFSDAFGVKLDVVGRQNLLNTKNKPSAV